MNFYCLIGIEPVGESPGQVNMYTGQAGRIYNGDAVVVGNPEPVVGASLNVVDKGDEAAGAG